MKRHSTDVTIGLRRDRRARGVTVRPDGTEIIYHGFSGKTKTQASPYAAADAPAARTRKKRKWKRLGRKSAAGLAASFAAILILLMGGKAAWDNCPAAIAIDGEPVCYLRNMDEAVKAMQLLVRDNCPAGTAVRAVDVGDSLSLKRTPGFGYKYRSVDKAMQYVRDRYLHTEKAEITTASVSVYDEQYTPDPDLRQDDDMLAGQERVESKAVTGTQKVTKQFSVRNGQSKAIDVLDVAVVDEGTPAVIYRGTLGLPEGEDWRTYEGMPVFNDGEDLIADAKHYLGLRYVWGGFNLNKGVDCVGFVVEMYKKFGIKLPHSHDGLRKAGVRVPSIDQARPGDIICYNGHVALYMGNGKIIHATRGKSNNVHISNSVNYNKKRHIITIRRIVN